MRWPSRGAISSIAARLASSIKPRSSMVTIAAGLVSTRTRRRSWAETLNLRLRRTSEVKSPHPHKARASKTKRIVEADGSRLLKRSLTNAHPIPKTTVAHLGRKPAASMMGKKKKKTREKKELVHQTKTANERR